MLLPVTLALQPFGYLFADSSEVDFNEVAEFVTVSNFRLSLTELLQLTRMF